MHVVRVPDEVIVRVEDFRLSKNARQAIEEARLVYVLCPLQLALANAAFDDLSDLSLDDLINVGDFLPGLWRYADLELAIQTRSILERIDVLRRLQLVNELLVEA